MYRKHWKWVRVELMAPWHCYHRLSGTEAVESSPDLLICPLAKSTVNPGAALLIQKWTKETQIWVFGEGLVRQMIFRCSAMIHTHIHGTAKRLHAGGFGGISI